MKRKITKYSSSFSKLFQKKHLVGPSPQNRYLYHFRLTTVGDFFDKAVDKTLNNQQFMNYAKNQKRQDDYPI